MQHFETEMVVPHAKKVSERRDILFKPNSIFRNDIIDISKDGFDNISLLFLKHDIMLLFTYNPYKECKYNICDLLLPNREGSLKIETISEKTNILIGYIANNCIDKHMSEILDITKEINISFNENTADIPEIITLDELFEYLSENDKFKDNILNAVQY